MVVSEFMRKFVEIVVDIREFPFPAVVSDPQYDDPALLFPFDMRASAFLRDANNG